MPVSQFEKYKQLEQKKQDRNKCQLLLFSQLFREDLKVTKELIDRAGNPLQHIAAEHKTRVL